MFLLPKNADFAAPQNLYFLGAMPAMGGRTAPRQAPSALGREVLGGSLAREAQRASDRARYLTNSCGSEHAASAAADAGGCRRCAGAALHGCGRLPQMRRGSVTR